LVIDTVVCLTLAKWETVSGQFGGYLKVGSFNLKTRSQPPQEMVGKYLVILGKGRCQLEDSGGYVEYKRLSIGKAGADFAPITIKAR
jgi:hypothetical protein